ncbi:MAG: hypothetical protein LBG97_04940 [Coriobacteriales bacterium]|nr:hypothetical protein [Coriobacteriales bacterium]
MAFANFRELSRTFACWAPIAQARLHLPAKYSTDGNLNQGSCTQVSHTTAHSTVQNRGEIVA